MRKVIAAFNMTLDGYSDHTAVTPDEEVHDHYTTLLSSAGVILYGRVTFELMGYWKDLIKNPSGQRSMDDFATTMDRIPKVVFSNTLTSVDWESARLAENSLRDEVLALREQPGGDILVGSRSLILELLSLGLLDELQLTVHPVIAGKGTPLFEKSDHPIALNLAATKTFGGGAVTFYYRFE